MNTTNGLQYFLIFTTNWVYIGFMSAALLKKVMEENSKNVTNVASDTGLSTNTVFRYLRGGHVHRANQNALERWVQEHSKSSSGPTAA